MRMNYSISLWNYYHYSKVSSLERIITLLREQGYGVELWGKWQEETDLFDEIGRVRLNHLLRGMRVSVHSAVVNTFDEHKKQIDTAAEWGAEVIVLHPEDLVPEGKTKFDAQFCQDIVTYATDHGVRLALENGKLPFLVNAIEKVAALGICLDVGHIYFTPDPMIKYLDSLKERIIHLHLQDILSPIENELPHTGKDHFTPGTGGIPTEDWELLAATLNEINFQGIAVFEIQPRNPLQTALLAKEFLEKFWNG